MSHDFLTIMLPQLGLLFFIVLQLVLSLFLSPRYYRMARWLSVVGISFSIVLLSLVQTEPQYFGLNNAVMSDSYTLLFHFMILVCGFFVVLLTKNLMSTIKQNAFSFQAIFLTAIFGAINVVSANDFLTLFISLELLSFPMYFLIASSKDYFSKEASFKYLITNAVSTGVFLFGVSYIYGLTSSLNFTEIYEITVSKETNLLYSFGSIMTVLGLISKLAVFPFANWIIDVYKGSETSILAFVSTIPKLALFGVLCRLLVFPMSNGFELTFVVIALSLITAFWANYYALREENIKSVFACSSAANASYVLLAASLVSVYNLSTVIFYLICYVLMNIAVFGYLNIAENNNIGYNINDFQGLFRKNKGLTLAYAIAVIGLAGIPITSGFVAKIYLFSALVHSGLIFLPFLLILLILTGVALYYYLKILTPLFNSDFEASCLKTEFSQKFVIMFLVAITVLIGVYPEKLIELCRYIAYNI